MNLFIISTAHHLLSVLNACNFFDIDTHNARLIVFFQKEELDTFNKLIIKDDWESVDFILGWNQSSSRIDTLIRIHRFKLIVKNSIRGRLYENFFIIQYTSVYTVYLMNKIKFNNLYLLDEGNASFIWASMRKIPNNYANNTEWLKRIIFNSKLQMPLSITFLSQYDIELPLHDKLINIDLSFLSKNRTFHRSNEILFLGAGFGQNDILAFSDYLDVCGNIYSRYSSQDVWYVPHRFESSEELKHIEKIGYKIRRYDIPIEFALLRGDTLPDKVISLFTAALKIFIRYFSTRSI